MCLKVISPIKEKEADVNALWLGYFCGNGGKAALLFFIREGFMEFCQSFLCYRKTSWRSSSFLQSSCIKQRTSLAELACHSSMQNANSLTEVIDPDMLCMYRIQTAYNLVSLLGPPVLVSWSESTLSITITLECAVLFLLLVWTRIFRNQGEFFFWHKILRSY